MKPIELAVYSICAVVAAEFLATGKKLYQDGQPFVAFLSCLVTLWFVVQAVRIYRNSEGER